MAAALMRVGGNGVGAARSVWLRAGMLLGTLLLCLPLQAQQIRMLTQTQTGADLIPLGYPVPLPQDTPLPFDGFRSYLGLHTRHQDLMLLSPRLQGEVVGQTLEGRAIWAYRVGDTDQLGAEGRPEPAVMINGGIHAREWQSPEVVTGLLETLVESADPAGLDRYLLDEVNLVIVPVLNIDGFLMTQAEPTRVWVGQDPISSDWPRDGRMRRKNHRSTDGVFSSSADHRGGVDLNRNNNPYWATSIQSTSDPNSLLHHGIAAASEPEIQALLQAAGLAPEPQLRAFVDVHSFGQVLFTIRTGNARRNSIMAALGNDFAGHHRAISAGLLLPNGRNYLLRPDDAGSGIGQTAEYFGNTWQIPAWTLEIEPVNGAGVYGGFGYSHDGFILPESQIRRVREQLAESHRVLLYHAAGPASVAALELRRVGDGELLQRSAWRSPSRAQRQLQLERAKALVPGQTYQLWLAFDRPMRTRQDGGSAVYPGQNPAQLLPVLRLVAPGRSFELPSAEGRWLGAPDSSGRSFARYREDAFALEFELPADFPAGTATLEIDVVDLLGRQLDAQPRSPAGWAAGHWTGYDSLSAGSEGDLGGLDDNLKIQIGADARIALLERPLQLSEGGTVSLRFERQGDVSAAARLNLAFEQSAGFVSSATQLDWLAGEGGAREILLVLRDDLQPGGERELRIGLSSAQALPTTELSLRLLDNDTDTLRRALIGELPDEVEPEARATRLAELMLAATAVDVPVQLQLAAGELRFNPLSSGAPPQPVLGSVDGDITIVAAQTRIDLAGRSFAMIPAGARLQLSGVQLLNGMAVTGATSGAAVLVNAGSLGLQDCQLRQMSGLAIASTGTLMIERCALPELTAAAVLVSGGTAELRNVTLADQGERIAGPIWRQLGGQADWQHVSLRGATEAAAIEVSAGALLRVQDSLISLARIVAGEDACLGVYSSAGGNVLGGPGCQAASGIDQRYRQAVIESIAPLTGSAVPADFVLAADRSCPQRDQLGMPRGASCLPGASANQIVFPRGLWWNPQRPGHGQHITLVENIAFLLWYTYDENGLPVTWTAQGPLVDGRMHVGLLQWRRQPVTDLPQSEQIGGVDLRVISGSEIHLGWGLNNGAGSGFEVLQPFRFRPDQAQTLRSGLYADSTDLGWGLTLQEEGDTAFALLYYFAADDRLRWASAQGRSGSDQRLAALSQTGVCLYCGDGGQFAHSAGELRLTALGPDELQFTAEVSATVAPGGSWLRQTRLQRFDPIE
jgi:hypothetical protein